MRDPPNAPTSLAARGEREVRTVTGRAALIGRRDGPRGDSGPGEPREAPESIIQ